jgi:hypothetical protein
MVGTLVEIALRFPIASDVDVHAGRDESSRGAQGRVVHRMHRQNLQGEQRPQLVEIDVRDELGARHRRVLRETGRPQQSLLLPGERREQHAAMEAVAVPLLREPDQGRHIGCIVESAIVEVIARDRLASAVTIEVSRHDHDLVPHPRVRAGQQGQHVVAGVVVQ